MLLRRLFDHRRRRVGIERYLSLLELQEAHGQRLRLVRLFSRRQGNGKNGEMRVYAKDGDMGYNRFFCATCGTTLYWKSFGFLPDGTGIAGGCFTDDPLPEPNFSAQDKYHCLWLSLPERWLKT
jgi:hypothetical protein